MSLTIPHQSLTFEAQAQLPTDPQRFNITGGLLCKSPSSPPSLLIHPYSFFHSSLESKQFNKCEKQHIKKLESSLKLYTPDNAPTLTFKETIEKTKRRFDNYSKYELLCGFDGNEKKSIMTKIIIDMPFAIDLIFRGFIWPVAAYRELINGDLIVKDI
ncbi:hypothetical protein GQ457_05G026820 [Hibiscus cannabinus]